ncbi:MAG: nucleotidyltransferase domain-containing protein [Verrucomicrobiota bacterium]|nr:nucleotidyltransferase domain-containing protein [Verrucomicrobiota bacterium]
MNTDATSTINDSIRKEINSRLAQIEVEENVRVLFACESGSRAWGFPSSDSDYDVRFVYAHPPDWYLSIEDRRDVIERPITDDIDCSGWDIRKALGLLRKSNPPLMEWLSSPIVYKTEERFTDLLRTLKQDHFSGYASAHHYFHMAQGNYKDYFKTENVRTKKYFYVLRPLLAVKWVQQGLGPVPMEFAKIVAQTVTDPKVLSTIEELIESKKKGFESEIAPAIPILTEFINTEIKTCETYLKSVEKHNPPVEPFDMVFREVIKVVP